jgi:SHS2 domain-containing protein
MKFEYLGHTADVKFRAYGKTVEDAFVNSAYAMTKSFCSSKVKGVKKKKISVEGKDFESLLYNFLEELLFLFDSEHFILSRVLEIKIKDFKLECEVVGDSGNYEIVSHIKSVTYNEMFVRQEKGRWVTQLVLDV